MASDTGVMGGAGVVEREGAALRLCCMCALTRWPAAKALHRDNSPAKVAAPMMRAKRRALSPGFVGCEPRTPSISSMALWGSRIVPPPRVPTSREGIDTEICSAPLRLEVVSKIPYSTETNLLLHNGDAVGALDNLGRVLTSGKEDGSNNVGSVGVESTHGTGHGGTNQVLGNVQLNQRVDVALEDLLDHIARDNSLSHNTLASSVNPVDGRGLLVSAVVSGDGDNLHVVKASLVGHDTEGMLDTLGDHVHAHGITSGGFKSDVQVGTGEGRLHVLQSGESASRVEGLLHGVLTSIGIKPVLGSTGSLQSIKANTGSTGHTIGGQNSNGTATGVDGLAASASAGNKDTLGGSHRDEVALSINDQGSSNTDRKGQVTNDVLTAGTKDTLPVVVLKRQLGSLQDVSEIGSSLGSGDDGTTNLDSTSKVLESLLQGITRDLATHRQGDNLLIAQLGNATLAQELLDFSVGAVGGSRGSGAGHLHHIGLIVGGGWRAGLGALRGRGDIFAQRQSSGAGIVESLSAGQLTSVDGVLRIVGVLDAPASDVEEVAVQADAQSQSNDDPLGEDGVLKALEQATDDTATNAVSLELVESTIHVGAVSTDGRSQRVVDRGVLQLILDGGEDGDKGGSVVGLGSSQNGVQAVGGNLEGVDSERRHNAAEAAGPRSKAGQRAGVAERDGAQVDNVDKDEAQDHENLELGDAAALGGKERRIFVAVDTGPVVIALGDVLGNASADTVVLEGHAHIDMALDAVDLELDAKNGGVEGEEQDAVEEEDPSSQEAEVLQTTLDTRGSAKDQYQNLDGIVADNLETLILDSSLDSVLDDVVGATLGGALARLGALDLSTSVLNGVRHDSAGEDNVLLEANGDNKERQALGQENDADGNAELGSDGQAEEEGKDRREEGADAEPELGAHAAHRQEERDKGQVHGNVAQQHDDNIQGLGVLEKIKELGPSVAGPLDNGVAGVDLGGLHDPSLLLAAVGGLDLLRVFVGDLLGSGEEVGAFEVGQGVGENAVLGVGREGVRGGRQGGDGQVLGDGDVVRARRGAGRVGREGVGEDEGQEREVLSFGSRSSILTNALPLPGVVGTGEKDSASLDEGRPVGLAHRCTLDIEVEEPLLKEADVRSAGEDGDGDHGVDRVRAGESREKLDEGGEAFRCPRWRGGLGDRSLAAEAAREEGSHDVERIEEGTRRRLQH